MQLSLYARLPFQTCGIPAVMNSESARVSDFSPMSSLQLGHICELSCYD